MAEKTVPATTQTETNVPATREESRYLIPPVDIYETEEGLVVVVDMPSVAAENADIRVENNILTIRGKATRTTHGDPLSKEFGLLDFFRQFELSQDVNQEKISAQAKNGVLTVHLPKQATAKPRQISVTVN